ncbi:hypothetical protein IW261DRAFT_1560321 [Armillaria novae-zelandiae]|uniref:Uncharacterized protein n=1 Tax=Armillaria novae-zelandiae TaxID=153914 RepID=A0AA39PI27_9AGAR|nr:hypothetical protein IW261DRAFT_1560321 [Armillaria novae-zelandiae]
MSSPFYVFSFAKKRMPNFDHKLGNLSTNIAADRHCLLRWVRNRYPEILDFSVIAYWSQPELASLIGLVHPFLCAHVQHFLHDTDPVAVRFLLSITIAVNNLGPYFIDANWSCWMIRDVHRWALVFDELGSLFGPDDQFPGDEGLPYPRYGSKPFFHVEPVLLEPSFPGGNHELNHQPLFENKDRFMKAYLEEPILLREGAFGARKDTQNWKNQLEGPYGSKMPDNPSLSARATGWIHANQEEKAAAAAAAAAARPSGLLTKEKLKKVGKIIKSKATVGNDTDLETNQVDEDVKMKGGEESLVLEIDSDESDNMSLSKEEPAHPTIRSCTTCKRRHVKHVASRSPTRVSELHKLGPCAYNAGDVSHPFLGCPTVVELLEKQDWVLAARSNKHLCQEFQAASRREPPKENLVFPIASWAANFKLPSKHETLETALKTVAASHLSGDKLELLQVRARQVHCELELLVHRLEATITAYQFCVKQQEFIEHKIVRLSQSQ